MQAEPLVVLFVNELRHYNKSAVCPGILTGGKGQELVAVFGGYARIVKRQFLAPLNIGCEIIGGLSIDKLIIFEAVGTIRIYYGDVYKRQVYRRITSGYLTHNSSSASSVTIAHFSVPV